MVPLCVHGPRDLINYAHESNPGKCSWKLDTYLPELFVHWEIGEGQSHWKGWPANFGICWSCIGVFDCGPVAVHSYSQQQLPSWWSCGSNNSVCRTEWITTKCIHCTRQCRQNPASIHHANLTFMWNMQMNVLLLLFLFWSHSVIVINYHTKGIMSQSLWRALFRSCWICCAIPNSIYTFAIRNFNGPTTAQCNVCVGVC